MTLRLGLAKAFATCCIWIGCAAAAQALPPLWSVADEDTRIWFFGSVHILPEDTQWRSDELETVLATADAVYFEAPLQLSDQERLGAETLKLGLVDSGTRLLDSLSAEEAAIVERAAKVAGVPMSGLNIWKPWMAANLLTTQYAAKQGYDFMAGVDMTLQNEIPLDQQRYFETIDEQLHFLADMPADKQIDLLLTTARDLDRNPDSLNLMVSAWEKGDIAELESAFLESMEAADPSWNDTLLKERNERWVAEIKSLLAEEPGNFLVVVGAAHLIGKDSVPTMLEATGLKVERVQ